MLGFRSAVLIAGRPDMSIFTNIPSEFPFEVDLSSRPVSFRLQADRSEVFIVMVLAIFWVVLGPVLIIIFMEIPAGLFPASDLWMWVQAILCGAYLIWVFSYFGQEILNQLRTVDVAITDDQVSVVDCRWRMREQWSEPLSAFNGIARHELGTHLVDNDKIPIASVVLQHPDPARTVPLVFRKQRLIGKKTVANLAAQLNVPPLEGVTGGDEAATYEAGTLVENQYQAMKVRILYWLIVGGGFMMLLSLAYHSYKDPFESEVAVLVVLCVAVMGAMHLFAACYVTSMQRQDDVVTLQTLAPLGSIHVFPRDRITSTASHAGKFDTVRHRVNAPWITVRVDGHYLPFIVDLQSNYVSLPGLQALMQNRK